MGTYKSLHGLAQKVVLKHTKPNTTWSVRVLMRQLVRARRKPLKIGESRDISATIRILLDMERECQLKPLYVKAEPLTENIECDLNCKKCKKFLSGYAKQRCKESRKKENLAEKAILIIFAPHIKIFDEGELVVLPMMYTG